MIAIGGSRAISHSDDTEQQAQQVAGNLRFSTETPLAGTLTKIHGQRGRRRQQDSARKAQRTSLTQQRQRRQHSDRKHVQKQRQNTTITMKMEPMKRGNTDCRRFKKRWGDQATLTV